MNYGLNCRQVEAFIDDVGKSYLETAATTATSLKPFKQLKDMIKKIKR